MARRDWLNILGLLSILLIGAAVEYSGAGLVSGVLESRTIEAMPVAQAPTATPPCKARKAGHGKICGKVVNGLGTPIAKAKIEAFRKDAGGEWSQTAKHHANSGPLGRYELNLTPGTYALRFVNKPRSLGAARWCVEYYSNTPDGTPVPTGVTVFNVADKLAQGGVNAVLDCAPTATPTDTTVPPATPDIMVSVTSDCARIDWGPGRTHFSVCALRDLTPTATYTAAPTHTAKPPISPTPTENVPNVTPLPVTPPPPQTATPPPPLPICLITVSVTFPCTTLTSNKLVIHSQVSPATKEIPMSCDGVNCTATLNSRVDFMRKELYTIEVIYQCSGGTQTSRIIGFTGLCDPKGNVNEKPLSATNEPTRAAVPVRTATVTLHYVPLNTPAAPGALTLGSTECYSASPGAGPTPFARPDFYWNNWSTVATATPALPIAGPTQIFSPPLVPPFSPVISTDSKGDYGWLTWPGYCYVVKVDGSITEPSGTWTAWSPPAGNNSSPGAYAVEDLSLTHYPK